MSWSTIFIVELCHGRQKVAVHSGGTSEIPNISPSSTIALLTNTKSLPNISPPPENEPPEYNPPKSKVSAEFHVWLQNLPKTGKYANSHKTIDNRTVADRF